MQSNQILVINSGSSSIKFAAFEHHSTLKKTINGTVSNILISPALEIYDSSGTLIRKDTFSKEFGYQAFYEKLISAFETNQFNYKIAGVGHRVVHGGTKYRSPVLITKDIIEYLKALIPFAPLHQPYNIEAIESITKHYPSVPQVACFDTAFHRTHPDVADCFGLPSQYTEAGVKRYGFHGLSYEYIMHKFNEIDPVKTNKRIIIAHLGNGASMCAINHKQSLDSTMGFSTLDGLVMGTRCGSIDPGVILYLMQTLKMTEKEIEELLYKKSGLLGVSGITSDMKLLLEYSSDSNKAKEAVELYVYRIKQALGSLTATLNGLDVLIFTGGIGEHAWQIREKICCDMDWLGLKIDFEKNKKNQMQISDSDSKIDVYMIPTNEEWIIANHTYQLIQKND